MKRTSKAPSIKTWGEGLDYTVRHRWKGMASCGTNLINSGHITDFIGRSFCLSKMSSPQFWREFTTKLKEAPNDWENGTINRILSAGRTVLNTLADDELINFDVPKIVLLKENESRQLYYTMEQVEKMVFVAVDLYERKDLADVIITAAYTGARQAELLKLAVKDVDWAENVIYIGGRKGFVTKSKKCRKVPIEERIADVIRARYEGFPPDHRLFGCDWTNKDQLGRVFNKVRDACGFELEHVFHSFRHSCATWLGECTAPKNIQQILGHADIKTTMKYVKATDKGIHNAMKALTDLRNESNGVNKKSSNTDLQALLNNLGGNQSKEALITALLALLVGKDNDEGQSAVGET